MTRDPVSQLVAAELESLAESGAHAVNCPRATYYAFSDGQRVRRAVEVGNAYLAMQTGVARNGRAAVVTAGPPGAGKTTALARAGFLNGEHRDIDADKVKDLLLERALTEGTFDDLLLRRLPDGRQVRPRELATLVHRESTSIAHNLTEVCARRGENLTVQGTLGWEKQPQVLLDLFEQNEYTDLTIFDVEVDRDTAIERALDRWWLGRVDATDPLGGRFTPRRVIDALYLPNGRSKCLVNAEVMLALSNSIPTTLRESSTVGGVVTEVVKSRDDVDPSLNVAHE